MNIRPEQLHPLLQPCSINHGIRVGMMCWPAQCGPSYPAAAILARYADSRYSCSRMGPLVLPPHKNSSADLAASHSIHGETSLQRYNNSVLVLPCIIDLDFGASEAAVRINPVSSGLAEEDLKVVLSAKRLPDALVVPKVESEDEVHWVLDRVKTLISSGWQRHLTSSSGSGGQADSSVQWQRPMAFIPMCESALSLLNLRWAVVSNAGGKGGVGQRACHARHIRCFSGIKPVDSQPTRICARMGEQREDTVHRRCSAHRKQFAVLPACLPA